MLAPKKMLLVLVLAFALMKKPAEAQLPDCYFQDVNLVPCLTNGAAAKTSEVCCQALSQALSSGQQCLCSILFSTNLFLDSSNPIPISPQGIDLPGCHLSTPSLAACQEVPALIMTPPPAIVTNPTAVTAPTPVVGVLVPNGTLGSRDAPVREGQVPMDLVSESGIIHQNGGSSLRQVQIINPVLCIASPLLVAFFVSSFK